MFQPIGKYKIVMDDRQEKYVRLYFEDIKILEKISVVNITFDKDFKGVVEGKLYSNQGVRLVKKRAYQNGWEDGYAEGKSEVENGGIEVLEKLEKRIAELEMEVAKARKDGWLAHKRKVENEEKQRQEEIEKEKIERSKRVAVGGGRKEALTAKQKEQIKELHKTGKSYREIAQLIGYKASHVTIGKVIKGKL